MWPNSLLQHPALLASSVARVSQPPLPSACLVLRTFMWWFLTLIPAMPVSMTALHQGWRGPLVQVPVKVECFSSSSLSLLIAYTIHYLSCKNHCYQEEQKLDNATILPCPVQILHLISQWKWYLCGTNLYKVIQCGEIAYKRVHYYTELL